MRLFRILLLISFIISTREGSGQARTTTVGLCFKPIFPISFLGTGPESVEQPEVKLTTTLKKGFSGGMVIRRGFTDLISAEAGIQYIRRDYSFELSNDTFSLDRSFRTVGYELPLTVMVFVQLGERTFMNGSLGSGIDAFASSVRTSEYNFEQIARKRYVVQPVITANLGWEYRSPASGTFYLGATFHRPFNDIYTNSVNYKENGTDIVLAQQLSGSYLTADLRYYFHEDPDVKRNKPKKRSK